jgi:hypothetical protein
LSGFDLSLKDKRFLSKLRWQIAVEEAMIVPFKKASKYYGLACKVGLTKELFDELYPYAEEANVNIEFMDRFDDIIKEFKRAARWSKCDFCEFDIEVPTTIKEKFNVIDISTWRRKRDKTVTIFATGIPDERGAMALVFGLIKTTGVDGKLCTT